MSELGGGESELQMGVVATAPIIIESPKDEGQKYGYIQETMQKVSDKSESNLQNFLDGENFIANLTVSLIDNYKMELLLKKFPNKRDQIMSLIPRTEDRHFMQDSGSTVYRRQVEREDLIEHAPWDLGEQEEFSNEARHLAKTEAEELLQKAKQEVESSQNQGLVLVVSLNNQDLLKVIKDGQYKASLDNPGLGYKSFRTLSKEKILEQATLTNEELADRTVGNTIGLGPLETRYLRELQMNTYLVGGDESGVPHPVYGQMIVDQDIGLSHAKEAGYGTLNLRLKTEKIKDRTTFFTGDSINQSWYGRQLGWNEAVKARAIIDKLSQNPKVDWRHITPYIEAHIMGGVLMQDIDGCDFESNEKTKELENYFSANPEKFEVTKRESGSVSVKFK